MAVQKLKVKRDGDPRSNIVRAPARRHTGARWRATDGGYSHPFWNRGDRTSLGRSLRHCRAPLRRACLEPQRDNSASDAPAHAGPPDFLNLAPAPDMTNDARASVERMVRSIFPSVRGNANHALDHRFYFTKAMPMHYPFRLLKTFC